MMCFVLPVLITAMMSAMNPVVPVPTWVVDQDVVQYKDLRAFRAADVQPGQIVMYDIEHWAATGKWQGNHPKRAMRAFVSSAHKRGALAMLAPSGGIFKEHRRVFAIPTDYLLVQAQNLECDPLAFARKVAYAARVQAGQVIAEVSVNDNRMRCDVSVVRESLERVGATADGIAVWAVDDTLAEKAAVEQLLGGTACGG